MNKFYFKIRSIARNFYLNLMGLSACPTNGIHFLNGHMIGRYSKNYNEGAKRFRSLLNELSKSCKLIKVEEAIQMIVNRTIVDEPLIAFTFDDGYEDCYTHIASILEEFNVNAMFFINPNFVEGNEDYIRHFTEVTTLSPQKRPMKWRQIKELHNRGFLIGAHTMDHYMINTDNVVELEYQIGYCKEVIEKNLGDKCEYFAFPYGRIEHANTKAIDIACKYYKYVFSQSDYKHYFSFDGRVINRRHFEPFWPINHVKYFLSAKKK